MDRKMILDNAVENVTGQRVDDYGTPENNFAKIAELWTAYKGADFTAHDVAMMMALLKVARIKSSPWKSDSYIDLAGYAACAGELAESAGARGG